MGRWGGQERVTGGIREEAAITENKEAFSRSVAKPQAISGELGSERKLFV
jgi:hypothetical protein